MRLSNKAFLLASVIYAASSQSLVALPRDSSWITLSNAYTTQLLDVEHRHAPEQGSSEGVVKFDSEISIPTLADKRAQRRELAAVVTTLSVALRQEPDKKVQQDLAILLKALNLQFRQADYSDAHEVPFFNASGLIFQGLRGLLDDQVAAERRPAAIVRLRKYVGLAAGYVAFTELLKKRELAQAGKAAIVYPSRAEMETELSRNSNYVEGIAELFKKYNLSGWEAPYAKLKIQLVDYDAWVRATLLPKARTDFRLQPQAYALAFEGYGIDITPSAVAEMAHVAFIQYQTEMAPLAAQIAKAHGYPSSDYRAVVAELKKTQIVGDAILPFYQNRLHEIESIIVAKRIVTLPSRPAVIRLATAAETAQQPAPHMTPPPFLHNTGQKGEFVLPLNIPGTNGAAADNYNDFTFDAVAWTLTAHEARPGHELQFDSMVEHGVSLARALYAFNSTNAEGWGLYSEYLMQPYEPLEGQLLTLQLRLLRAARAFLDPGLQSGAVTIDQAFAVLEKDVMLSHAFAQEEVERFTYRAPGQANSYFYGYTRLMSLRAETEALLGKKFDQLKFHDFILGEGLLPPDLLRKAVLEDFVPLNR